jgi:hypothetical protein
MATPLLLNHEGFQAKKKIFLEINNKLQNIYRQSFSTCFYLSLIKLFTPCKWWIGLTDKRFKPFKLKIIVFLCSFTWTNFFVLNISV